MIIFMNHVLAAGRSSKAEILYTTVKVCFKQALLHHQGSDCHDCHNGNDRQMMVEIQTVSSKLELRATNRIFDSVPCFWE